MLLAVTMGDASGVGPELILKAYLNKELAGDFIVIGDYQILKYCAELLQYDVPLRIAKHIGDMTKGFVNVLDLDLLGREDLQIGQISKRSGYAARKYVECAVELAIEKKIDAIVTLPMNKESTRLSDENFTGHTELIAEMCGEANHTMMLASDKLIVTHVSTHVPMADAIKLITKERVYNVIKLTHDSMKRLIENPRIAVAGLNPHAGENGSFGMEEINEIGPAVMRAKHEQINAEGPIAPDTVFFKAYRKQYDAVVSMYHDQGHIPMKVLDFEGGVNITLGLKIIRTSVDHGTAFDIAYKGIASPKSFVSAYKFALNMAANRV